MNKAEFLAGLRDALAGKLPSGELEDVLSYYEEYFADAGEEHEAEAAEGLGSPASVAAQVLEGRTGQAPSAASAERRPRRLWPVAPPRFCSWAWASGWYSWPNGCPTHRRQGNGSRLRQDRSLWWWSRTRFPHRRKTSWSWSPLPP